MTPGKYKCNSVTNASTLKNCPIQYGFSMYVEPLGYGDWFCQTIKRASGNETFSRIYNHNTLAWESWVQNVLISDLTPTAPQTIRSQCRYSKSGNVVTVYCAGLQAEVPANTWANLFTLPPGYRPNSNIHGSASFGSGGSKSGVVRIATNGECDVFSSEITTVSWFAVSFPVGS